MLSKELRYSESSRCGGKRNDWKRKAPLYRSRFQRWTNGDLWFRRINVDSRSDLIRYGVWLIWFYHRRLILTHREFRARCMRLNYKKFYFDSSQSSWKKKKKLSQGKYEKFLLYARFPFPPLILSRGSREIVDKKHFITLIIRGLSDDKKGVMRVSERKASGKSQQRKFPRFAV